MNVMNVTESEIDSVESETICRAQATKSNRKVKCDGDKSVRIADCHY